MGEGITSVRCKVMRVRYQSGLFAICLCETTDKLPEGAAQGGSAFLPDDMPRNFVALGDGMCAEEGKEVVVTGTWEQNKKFGGVQLRISYCEDYTGQGREEIVAYLSSKALKGIGRQTAEAIYDKFGENSPNVIADNPELLLQVPGIKEKKLKKLVSSYEKNHALHALARLLARHKVTFQSVVRIFNTLGENSVGLIKQNPYILTKVRGFGFVKTDEIALSMGIERNSKFRIEGALRYVLIDAQDSEGHMFLPRGELVHRCCFKDILNKKNGKPEDFVTVDMVNKVLDELLAAEKPSLCTLVLPSEENEPKNQRIYTSEAFQHETLAAKRLSEFLSQSHSGYDEKACMNAIKATQKQLGVTLDVRQEEAVLMALMEHVSIITGGPGTGKTTTLNVLVNACEYLRGEGAEINLAAPTGRAARRMTEQTGREAFTLHSLFKLSVRKRGVSNYVDDDEDAFQLESTMLVIDESSMIDAQLLADILVRTSNKTKIVFVGDVDQLPSVGAGNVLKQLLMTPAIKHVKLEKIFRQGEDSVIPVNSKRVKAGIKELIYNKYFKLIPCETETEAAERICALFSGDRVKEQMQSIQILAPMRRRGDAGINSLNEKLHDIVNPPAPEKVEFVIGNTCYRVGDKVMHVNKNTDNASNGDIGYIASMKIPPDGNKDNFSLTVEFAPDWCVEYDYVEAIDTLEHATAITIHKSQGSEFPIVVIPILGSMSFFLQRNLFYTAITRAKLQVVVVGQERAVATAISKIDNNYRNTMLSVLIQNEMTAAKRAPSLL